MLRHAGALLAFLPEAIGEGLESGLFRPVVRHPGPAPLRSGERDRRAAVFLVSALPSVMPQVAVDPLTPLALDAHRENVLRISRDLLGMPDPDIPQGQGSE